VIGETLAHFRITAKLGAGGMGEVYRAEDTRLGREVAIKVLPEAFTADPERLARFEREARVLASLNHPNIAGIHQVEEAEGLRLLVMELVDGEDLSARIARGPLPPEEALRLALQIAEALESAHERGIVHRDLKPANVKVTPDGQAKVLDFGLAKALEGPASGSASALSLSPTLTAGMTGAGVLLGTAAYMSPEQAKGLEPDRRADVWAFGVVLWEMLTGQRLFSGDSVSDTLAAVLRDEVDLAALPAATPAPVSALVARCLDRDPKSRLRDIGEARVALAAIDAGTTSTLLGAIPPSSRAEAGAGRGGTLGWLVAAAVAVVALALGALGLRPSGAPLRVIHSDLVAPQDADLDAGNGLALSPDGTRIAFAARDAEGKRALWVRSFETGESQRLHGTDEAMYPFFSPDGRNLGFMAQGSLKRIPAAGGPVQTLAAVREGRGGTWSPDGTIVFAPDFRGGLWRIPAAGGEPVELTSVDPAGQEQSHRFPVFLPGGDRLLFLAQTAEGGSQVDASRIELLELATGERSTVVAANSSMAYHPSGRLLFWRDGSLVVAAFDPQADGPAGDAVPIAAAIGYTGNEFATFAISQGGLLAYQAGSAYEAYTRLVVTDSTGLPMGEWSPPDFHRDLSLSHDGSRVVYSGGDHTSLWIRDLERQTRLRFTFDDGDHDSPVWSPDDEWIAYATSLRGKFQLFRKAASGLGSVRGDKALMRRAWSSGYEATGKR